MRFILFYYQAKLILYCFVGSSCVYRYVIKSYFENLGNRINTISFGLHLLLQLNKKEQQQAYKHHNYCILLHTGFQQYRTEKRQSEPYATYTLLTNSQQKRAAKNQIQSVFGNIGLERGSLSHTLLIPYSLTANKKELRRIILERFSVIQV